MSLYKSGDYVVLRLNDVVDRIDWVHKNEKNDISYTLCNAEYFEEFLSMNFNNKESKKLNDFCDKIKVGDYLVISENASDTHFSYTENTLKQLVLKANQPVQVVDVFHNRLFKVEGIDSFLTIDVFIPNVIIPSMYGDNPEYKDFIRYCLNDVKSTEDTIEKLRDIHMKGNNPKYHVGDKVIITKDISTLIPKGKLAEITEIKLNCVTDIRPIEYKLSVYGLYSECFVTDDYFTKVEGNSYKPSIIGTFTDKNGNENTLIHLHIDEDSIETWEDVTVPNSTEYNYTVLSVGDTVCISPYVIGFTHCMEKYRCNLANITEVTVRTNSDGKPFALYKLDIDNGEYYWTNSMFSNVIHTVKSSIINDNIKEENKMNKARYKVGDLIRIKKDLKGGTYYGSEYVARAMTSFKGKIATITYVGTSKNIAGVQYFYYYIDLDNYIWTEEMFEDTVEPVYNGIVTDNVGHAYKYDKNGIAHKYTKEEKKMIIDFKTVNSERYVSYGKHNGATIPQTTTEVTLPNGKKGYATIDTDNYNEREGILNAVANAVYNGNFDKAYDATKKAEAKVDKEHRTCNYCGTVYDTVEEKEECVKAHIQRKKDKKEAYAIRKEAKRRLEEKIREDRILTAVEELSDEYETVEDGEVTTESVENVENVETESVENVENVENSGDTVNEGQ